MIFRFIITRLCPEQMEAKPELYGVFRCPAVKLEGAEVSFEACIRLPNDYIGCWTHIGYFADREQAALEYVSLSRPTAACARPSNPLRY